MNVWKIAIQLIRFRPKLYMFSFILWAMVHGIPLVTGIALQKIFDSLGHQATNMHDVGLFILLLVVSLITRAAVLIAGFYVDFTFIFVVTALLRKNVLRDFFNRPSTNALSHVTGDIISRFRDDCNEIASFVGWTSDLIYRPFFAILALIIMFNINVKLTLVTIIPLAILMGVSHFAKANVEKYRRENRQSTGAVTGFIADVFDSIATIKTSGSEKNISDHLQKLNEQRQAFAIKDQLFSDLLNTLYENSIRIGTGLVLLFAARPIQEGTLSIGDLVLFIFYLGWLGEVTNVLGRIMALFKQAEVSVSRVLELNGCTQDTLLEHGPIYLNGTLPEVDYVAKSAEHVLETLDIKKLTYMYPNSNRGIHDFNLHIKKGTLTVISGQIGSGKTTLIRALLGSLPKQEGEIRWNDQVVQDEAAFFK